MWALVAGLAALVAAAGGDDDRSARIVDADRPSATASEASGGGPVPVTHGGITATVTTAYRTTAGDLAVNVDITNALDAPVTLADYDWLYRAPDGRRHTADQTYVSAPTVAPGATAAHAVLFSQVEGGGALTVIVHPEPMGEDIRLDLPTA